MNPMIMPISKYHFFDNLLSGITSLVTPNCWLLEAVLYAYEHTLLAGKHYCALCTNIAESYLDIN